MGALLAAAIPAAASLAGGVMANQASAKAANTQMDFQREMSTTQHQRQVADLKAAGLNPILSANSGAAVPQGAMPEVKDVLGPAVASAFEGRRLSMEADKQREEIANLKETNKLLNAQARKTNVEAVVVSKDIPQAELKNQIWNRAKKEIESISSGAKSLWNDPWGHDSKVRLKQPVLNPHKNRR